MPGTKRDADGVERVFKSYLSLKMRDVPDLLHHITTSFSPRLLDREGVHVCKLLQCAGEYIVRNESCKNTGLRTLSHHCHKWHAFTNHSFTLGDLSSCLSWGILAGTQRWRVRVAHSMLSLVTSSVAIPEC